MSRKNLTAAFLTMLLIAIPLMAQPPAQGPMGRGGPGSCCPMGPPQMGEKCEWLMELKLTDEQRTAIQNLRLEHQKKMVELQSDIAGLKGKLGLLIIDESFNAKEVDKIAGELAKAHQKSVEMRTRHLRTVRDQLTDEQRVMFDQKVLSGRIDFGHGPEHGKAPGMKMKKHRSKSGKKRCW